MISGFDVLSTAKTLIKVEYWGLLLEMETQTVLDLWALYFIRVFDIILYNFGG